MSARIIMLMNAMDGFLCGFLRRFFLNAGDTSAQDKPEIIMPIDKTTGIITSGTEDIEIPAAFVHEYVLEHVVKNFDPDRPFEVGHNKPAGSTYRSSHIPFFTLVVESLNSVSSWLL